MFKWIIVGICLAVAAIHLFLVFDRRFKQTRSLSIVTIICMLFLAAMNFAKAEYENRTTIIHVDSLR